MFTIPRLLLILVVIVTAYGYWPRESWLDQFDPARMGELQVKAWRQSATGSRMNLGAGFDLGRTYYSIYAEQYKIAPATAAGMAFNSARAMMVFQKSADYNDQETALEYLTPFFTKLKNNTRASFNPETVARAELQIWRLQASATDPAAFVSLTSALAEQIALVYNSTKTACLPAAKKFAVAMQLAAQKKWTEAQTANQEGWSAVLTRDQKKPN